MKTLLYLSILLVFLSFVAKGQSKKVVFLFAYFKNNGQDGLHLAYSTDAYNQISLPKGLRHSTILTITKREFNQLLKQ